MKVDQELIVVTCPDCEEEIQLEADIELGEKITCPECWADLKVVSLNPVRLAWDLEDEEDWESEEEFVERD